MIDPTIAAIGWIILLLTLILGAYLGGITVGLLSGLGLGLLTFSRVIQPASPPYELMTLQATWFIFMATLEAAAFFAWLESKLFPLCTSCNGYRSFLQGLLCYLLVFLTGDNQWCTSMMSYREAVGVHNPQRWMLLAMVSHMALLVSPLSLSGMIYYLVISCSEGSPLYCIGQMVALTIGMIGIGGLLTYLLPYRWLITIWTKIHKGIDYNDSPTTPFTNGHLLRYIPLLLLLLLIGGLFLLVKPEKPASTLLPYIGKVFNVKCAMFFALIMLSTAAVALFAFHLKPIQILQAHRFKLGIQPFFIFIGFTWLLDTLIGYDKTILLKMIEAISLRNPYLFIAPCYLFLIDLPIVIWLLIPRLIEQGLSLWTLAIGIVVTHTLTGIKQIIYNIVKK